MGSSERGAAGASMTRGVFTCKPPPSRQPEKQKRSERSTVEIVQPPYHRARARMPLWVDDKLLNNNGIHPPTPGDVSIDDADVIAVFKLFHTLGRLPFQPLSNERSRGAESRRSRGSPTSPILLSVMPSIHASSRGKAVRSRVVTGARGWLMLLLMVVSSGAPCRKSHSG